ncbi:MAG: SH3 domain-containing protein [Oscillospiraceae bacterium]|nr:SH3 domain-containing protein [Oscillospiraceae bacterium]
MTSCKKCGGWLNPESNFCPKCGAPADSAETESKEPGQNAVSGETDGTKAEESKQTEPGSPPSENSKTEEKTKKSYALPIIITGICVIVVGIIAAAVLLYSGYRKNNPVPETTAAANAETQADGSAVSSEISQTPLEDLILLTGNEIIEKIDYAYQLREKYQGQNFHTIYYSKYGLEFVFNESGSGVINLFSTPAAGLCSGKGFKIFGGDLEIGAAYTEYEKYLGVIFGDLGFNPDDGKFSVSVSYKGLSYNITVDENDRKSVKSVEVKSKEFKPAETAAATSAPAAASTEAPPEIFTYDFMGYAYVKTKGDNLNLRKGPSTGSAVILSMPNGAEVEVYGYSANWYYVCYQSTYGYVSRSYISWPYY